MNLWAKRCGCWDYEILRLKHAGGFEVVEAVHAVCAVENRGTLGPTTASSACPLRKLYDTDKYVDLLTRMATHCSVYANEKFPHNEVGRNAWIRNREALLEMLEALVACARP